MELPQCLVVGLGFSRMLKLFRRMSRLFTVLFICIPMHKSAACAVVSLFKTGSENHKFG